MDTNHHPNDVSNDEPNAKRSKMETECSSTSSSSTKPNSKKDEPFLSLPADVLAKIIIHLPIDEWAALELLDEHFRASTFIAWRQLRTINLEREFFSQPENEGDRSSFAETVAMVNSILHKLAERSPFLTSLNGFELQSVNANLNSDAVRSLARFERLQSITVGDAKFYTALERGTPLENVVEFLESTQSRASLKELRLMRVVQKARCRGDRATILEQFASSFVNGREIREPLKLETFSFMSYDYFLRIRLDTLDTTRLTDVRLGKACVEPSQLTNLIERASNLNRIDLSLIYCCGAGDEDDDEDEDDEDDEEEDIECDGPRLPANKKLLTALASHGNLTTVNFVSPYHYYHIDCNCVMCGPELTEMLKIIGRRGRLRKLSFDDLVIHPDSIDMEEMCATIRQHIPYLRSIKICVPELYDVSVEYEEFIDIISMTELEEIDLHYMPSIPWTKNAMEKIAQLPHLKRLGLHSGGDDQQNSLKYLTDAKSLTDLRISHASFMFRAGILDGWTEEFASKLEILMLSSCVDEYDHDEDALVRLLTRTVRLRVLILDTRITDQSLMAIAKSCPQLEILSVRSKSDEISVQYLQGIVDRCPKLKRLGGFGSVAYSEIPQNGRS